MADIVSPTLQRRQEEHESRLPPIERASASLQEAREAVNRLKIEESQLKTTLAQVARETEDFEQKKVQLADQIAAFNTEKQSLQAEVAQIREERDRLAAEDEAFAEEHLRHDAALKQGIKQLEELAEEIKRIASS